MNAQERALKILQAEAWDDGWVACQGFFLELKTRPDTQTPKNPFVEGWNDR